jgi:hypothetical protein
MPPAVGLRSDPLHVPEDRKSAECASQGLPLDGLLKILAQREIGHVNECLRLDLARNGLLTGHVRGGEPTLAQRFYFGASGQPNQASAPLPRSGRLVAGLAMSTPAKDVQKTPHPP